MKKNKVKKLIIFGIASVLIVLIVLFLVGFFKPKGAGIRIETVPDSTVYIDGVQVGRTPYKDISDPGEVVVKLVPESFEKPLIPYERKITLVSGVETTVFQEFSETEEDSSGIVVSFEKVATNETSISAISTPDAAQVSIDGIIKGYTPYKTTDIIEGEHSVKFTSPDLLEKEIKVQVYKGYRATIEAKMARNPNVTVTPTPQPEEEKKLTQVEISSTPTDFLRVRKEPSTFSDEVGRVNPGERYKYVKDSEDGKWFQISYDKDDESKLGWVSATYAKKVEDSESVETSLTPTSEP